MIPSGLFDADGKLDVLAGTGTQNCIGVYLCADVFCERKTVERTNYVFTFQQPYRCRLAPWPWLLANLYRRPRAHASVATTIRVPKHAVRLPTEKESVLKRIFSVARLPFDRRSPGVLGAAGSTGPLVPLKSWGRPLLRRVPPNLYRTRSLALTGSQYQQ